MTTKKIILATAITALATVGFSQKAYISFNTGYAMGAGGDRIGTINNSSATDFSSENVYGTFGVGIPLTLTGGYMINKNVGFELGLNYLLGSKVTAFENNNSVTNNKTTVTGQTSQFRLLPSMVVTTANEKLNFYAKAGLVLPVAGKTVREQITEGPGLNLSETTETTGAISLGFTGSAGVSLALSEKMSLFGELQGINLRVKQGASKITESTTNGTDNLPGMTTSSIETNYVDEINSNTNTAGNTSFDANKPSDNLAATSPFSSIGINIGIKIHF